MTQVQARFLALWSRLGGARGDAVYTDLARYYGEPVRHYHTLQHVRRCLRDFDWAGAAIPEADVVELALWCHDVIYVPGAPDNEQRSADWLLHRADGQIPAAARVASMILATTHRGTPTDLSIRFAVDIDLAMLGADRDHFRRNALCLRAERADLDDATYDRTERSFLGALLARDTIYHTDLFHARCEDQARRNLTWRLAQSTPPWATGA